MQKTFLTFIGQSKVYDNDIETKKEGHDFREAS